jgi:hypothetical protein
MKKVLRFFLYLIVALIVVIGGLMIYVKFFLPNVGTAPDLTVERTPERIERGKYMANHVAVCIDCHSKRDWTKFSGPITPGTEGMGGEIFDHTVGLPGIYYASNITPASLDKWTDGEIFRAITSGVNKDGKALFPIMPYLAIGQIDLEDVYSIIAYIRTLKPVVNNVPPSKSDFPMNFIINTMPRKPDFHTKPDKADKVTYGKYLSVACIECHSMFKGANMVKGMEFAGGREFPLAGGGIVRSTNLTPDPETGIGNWTEQFFIARFKAYSDSTYVPANIGQKDFNTYMPWTRFSGMTTDDLSGLYAFLKSLKPITHKVVKYTPPA